MNRLVRQSALLVCVIAAMVMRAAIPAGYMPASAGSGLLFELCPSAVPAEILMAMSGSEHVHHHGGDGDEPHFSAEQCPIGQLLSVAVAVDVAHVLDDTAADVAPVVEVRSLPGSASPLNCRSRSPPA